LISTLNEGVVMDHFPPSDGEEVQPIIGNEGESIDDSKGKAKRLMKKVDRTRFL